MLSWQGPYQSEELCLKHHQWEKTGDYELKVKVKDTFGHETNWLSSMNVTIQEQSSHTPENSIPTARFTYEPNHPATGDIVSFHDQSYDPDGNITKHLWDFGDNATSNQKNPTHQYNTNKNRSYIVTLTVWDDNVSLSTTNKQITIQNMHLDYSSEANTVTQSCGILCLMMRELVSSRTLIFGRVRIIPGLFRVTAEILWFVRCFHVISRDKWVIHILEAVITTFISMVITGGSSRLRNVRKLLLRSHILEGKKRIMTS